MKTQIQNFSIILAVILIPGLMQAQNKKADPQPVKKENVSVPGDSQRGINFIDENKNGICDRFENRKSLGRGPNFTDADKNGICDHRENGTRGNGKGYGFQRLQEQRNGQCCRRGPCGGKGWKNR